MPIPQELQQLNQQKLQQMYLDLLAKPIPEPIPEPSIADIYKIPAALSKKWGEKHGLLGKVGGALVGGIGGLVSAAATPLGAGIAGLAMKPYEGAGFARGAAQASQRRQLANQGIEAQRAGRIGDLREFLKGSGAGGGIAGKKFSMENIPEGFEVTGFWQDGSPKITKTKGTPIKMEEVPEGFEVTSLDAIGNVKTIKKLEDEPDLQQVAELGLEPIGMDAEGRVRYGKGFEKVKAEAKELVEQKIEVKRIADVQKEKVKILSVMPLVKQMREMLEEIPVPSGIPGLVGGGIQKLGAITRIHSKAAAYDDLKKSTTSLLSKSVAQNIGTLSDLDIKRAEKLTGDLLEPGDLRTLKFDNLEKLIVAMAEARGLTVKDVSAMILAAHNKKKKIETKFYNDNPQYKKSRQLEANEPGTPYNV